MCGAMFLRWSFAQRGCRCQFARRRKFCILARSSLRGLRKRGSLRTKSLEAVEGSAFYGWSVTWRLTRHFSFNYFLLRLC